MGVNLKTKKDIKKLAESGKILAFVLKEMKEMVEEGVLLSDLNDRAKHILDDHGAKAAFYGYKPGSEAEGFPGYICASVNDQVVHGVPGDYKLRDGDVLKLDFGVDYKEMITDAAITVPVGDIDPVADKLMKTTRLALEEAISVCKPGNHLGDIGWIVEQTVKENGFSIVRALGGHGVGFDLHEDPTVFNYGEKGTGMELVEGMVLAIEPITSAGSGDIKKGEDGSFVTLDGSLSAHFEKTLAITEDGCKILTPWDK